MKFQNCCGRVCVVLDVLVLKPIFGTGTTHILSGHTKFLKCCERICLVLDTLVLITIFCNNTTHIPN